MTRGGRRWSRAGWVAWPAALAAILTAPLLALPGYPLARDLVFVPRQPLTDAALGLGDGSPRAVPLDAVVSLLTVVADGAVWARVLVPLAVALAGWGVLRLLPDAGTPARLVASGLAVWNPFVVERLALGQWALLLGYGALPWIAVAARAHRRGGGAGAAGRVVAWAGLASLTPTGGLLALATTLVVGVTARVRCLALVLPVLLLQAPWVVAALAGTAARTSDPAGVDVFAPDTDGPGGPLVALVGLGGIWDDVSEPATRGTWLALVAAAVTVVALVAGGPALVRRWGRDDVVRAVVLGLGLAAVALVGSTGPGQEALRWVVVEVPGAGLLRDTQKLIAPLVVLVAAAAGAAVDALTGRLAHLEPEVRVAALMPLVAAPFLLLPDATTVTWPTVCPVTYPDDLARGVAALDDADPDELAVVLPWRSYRLFSWGHGATSSDPVSRWSSARVVTSDDLQVGETLVRGESRLAGRIGEALEQGPPAQVLPGLGVGWVVLQRDDPAAGEVDTTGLFPVFGSDLVAVYAVPDAVSAPAPSAGRRTAVVLAHGTALLVLLGGLVAAAAGAARRKPTGSAPTVYSVARREES